MSNTDKAAGYALVNKKDIPALMEFIVKWCISAIYKHSMDKNRVGKGNREYHGGEALLFLMK